MVEATGRRRRRQGEAGEEHAVGKKMAGSKAKAHGAKFRSKALKVERMKLLEMGYQAEEKRQFPIPRFPLTLASYVLVFQTDDEWISGEGVSYAKLTMQPILDKLRSADIIVREFMSSNNKYMFALVSIAEKRQKMIAEIMGEYELIRLRLQKLDDEMNEIKGAGAWMHFQGHLAPHYEKSTEGTVFSSCQQQHMIHFLLNDVDERVLGPQLMQKEACEPGNSILEQLQIDEKIVDHFPLHQYNTREWLEKFWVEAYANKQPIEDIREYFGEEIALYFAWYGFTLKMMWIPAILGVTSNYEEVDELSLVQVLVFVAQIISIQSGSVDNPFTPLFSLFGESCQVTR